jgi:hypothetical protein
MIPPLHSQRTREVERPAFPGWTKCFHAKAAFGIPSSLGFERLSGTSCPADGSLTSYNAAISAILKNAKSALAQSVVSDAGVKFTTRRKLLSTSAKALRAGFRN